MTDDLPTQRLPQSPEPTGDLVEERKKSRALLFTLIGVGAALLIAIIVLLVMLFTGGDVRPNAGPTDTPTPTVTPTTSDSPTPSATPSEEPEPEPTQDPPPPPPPPSTIISYQASTTDANCSDPSDQPEVTFNWNTTGQSVAFGVGTEFAETQPYDSGLPRVGGITINYQCGEDGPDQIYSIAVIGPNGDVIGRQTIKIRD